MWKPPQASGGAKGTGQPWVSLWVFSGGGARIWRMALLYSLVKLAKAKEVPLHRLLVGPRDC